METQSKIAIIGAGPVGLSAAAALKRKNISYDQYEATSRVGGNWSHGVYRKAHIISSKRTTEFSDYPMPASYPDFPSADQMLSYLDDYCEHFALKANILFEKKVENIAPTGDGKWLLKIENGDALVYNGVIICNGHHWDKRWPKYEGEFSGEFIHSKDYQDSSQLAGKRVLVIGGGNSACDIACDAARVAKKTTLSLRRGYWFLPKTFYGKPTAEMLDTWMPVWLQRIYLQLLLRIVVGDYRDYGLPLPDHKLFEHHPTINTELLHYLKHGRINVCRDIKMLDGNFVHFLDGERDQFDIVICATGYNVSFPFLSDGIIATSGPVVKVRWGMVAPENKQLYVYGWAQARYGFGPLLTPASDLLADLIVLQNELQHPLGKILEKLRQPLAESHLLDPMDALRQIRAARKMLKILPLVDKSLN